MFIKFQKSPHLTPWFESVFHSQLGISLHHTTVNQNAETDRSIRPWHFSFWPQRRPGFPELCQCLEVGPLATELAQRKDKINASRWGEGWRGWSSGGFNTNLLSNFGRFVPQPLATQRKLIPRDVNAISRCPGFGLRSDFAMLYQYHARLGSFIPYWTAAAHITCIRASSAVKMVTTLPDESPKR